MSALSVSHVQSVAHAAFLRRRPQATTLRGAVSPPGGAWGAWGRVVGVTTSKRSLPVVYFALTLY